MFSRAHTRARQRPSSASAGPSCSCIRRLVLRMLVFSLYGPEVVFKQDRGRRIAVVLSTQEPVRSALLDLRQEAARLVGEVVSFSLVFDLVELIYMLLILSYSSLLLQANATMVSLARRFAFRRATGKDI